MAVPKNRHTKSRRNTKRAHIKLQKPQTARCEKCGVLKLSHTLCENCGTYKGRMVVDVLAKLDKKERKQREKEIQQQETVPTGQEMSMEELSK
jgi:large subunit ribosomal protein L32